jgi:hypothetical protein
MLIPYFAKSPNRANVALSRARHGMFILGNSDDLACQSDMWKGVVEELKESDCIGPGFPITCYNHPNTLRFVTSPGQLPAIAPDGEDHSSLRQGLTDKGLKAVACYLAESNYDVDTTALPR